MKNNDQKARIEAMKREIERRGGMVGSMAPVSDDVLEFFLREVLDCPECSRDGADPLVPRRRARHGH
jgi:hypothetical protein